MRELARRGHLTVDTDCHGWVLDGNWDEGRMTHLLHHESSIVVSGTAENQAQFYDRFDAVILMTAPLDVLLERVRQRSDNPYGTTKADREEIRGYVVTVQPLLRLGATHELDGTSSVSELADATERILAG